VQSAIAVRRPQVFEEDGIVQEARWIFNSGTGAATLAPAAQLSTDARGAIPHDVQQLVVIDYRAMQNSTAAMNLKNRVMPPELKQFDEALNKFTVGAKDASGKPIQGNRTIDQYVDELAFALFRPRGAAIHWRQLGLHRASSHSGYSGELQSSEAEGNAGEDKQPLPDGEDGDGALFRRSLDHGFRGKDAVTKAIDARDGMAASLLTNGSMMNAMQSVDSNALWSILDDKGTQTMMKQLLGDAGSVTDFQSVRNHLDASWYGMDFQNGVKFNLTIDTGDSLAAATVSSLMSAAVMMRKMSASDTEKAALSATDIGSDSGKLVIHFASTDSEFSALLQSPLFQTMVK